MKRSKKNILPLTIVYFKNLHEKYLFISLSEFQASSKMCNACVYHSVRFFFLTKTSLKIYYLSINSISQCIQLVYNPFHIILAKSRFKMILFLSLQMYKTYKNKFRPKKCLTRVPFQVYYFFPQNSILKKKWTECLFLLIYSYGIYFYCQEIKKNSFQSQVKIFRQANFKKHTRDTPNIRYTNIPIKYESTKNI